MDFATSIMEYAWLWDVEQHGITVEEISQREHLSERRVRIGLARAGELHLFMGDTDVRTLRPPHLDPISPIPALTPFSACPHHGVIRKGLDIYCVVCSCSGQDHHPALQHYACTDPKPEPPPPEPPPDVAPPHKETRRERRLRIFGPPQPKPQPEAAA
jgi:hypothetical protein